MKFKIDENIPLQLRRVIIAAGHIVSDVYHQNLAGKNDTLVFETCKKEGYVLVTLDSDFDNISCYPPNTHPGIIVFKLKSQGARAVIEAFQRLIEKVGTDRIEGSITLVGQEIIKLRKEL